MKRGGAGEAWGRRLGWLGWSGVLLVGLLTLLIGLAPESLIEPALGALTSDGRAGDLEAAIRVRARVIGPLLLILAGVVWTWRRRAGQWLGVALHDLGDRLWAGFGKSRRAVWARDPVALALLVIVVIGAALRIAHVNEPVEYDEAWTVLEFVSQPAPVGLTRQREANNHVLHTLLARPFFVVAGYRMAAIRIPVLVAGILLLPLVFLLGQRAQGPLVGLWAACLTVVAGPVLLYSFRARGYEMVTLAFVALLILGFDLLRSPRDSSWLAFVLVSALGAFVTPAMIYPFLVAVVWLVLDAVARAPARGRRPFFRELTWGVSATGVLTLLLYTPFFLVSGPSALVRPPFAAPVSIGAFFAHYGSAETWAALGDFLTSPFPAWAGVVLGIGAVIGACVHGRTSSRPLSPLVGLLCLPAVVFAQRVMPPERIWTFVVPVLLLGACTGIGWVVALLTGSPRVRAAGVWLAAGTALLLAGAVEWRSDFLPRARYLAGYDRPDLVARCLTAHLGPHDSLVAKAELSWPTRFLFRAHGFDERRLNAHRRTGFSGRSMFLTVHGPLEESVALELAETDLDPGRLRYARLLDRCGNATLHEVGGESRGDEWRTLEWPLES